MRVIKILIGSSDDTKIVGKSIRENRKGKKWLRGKALLMASKCLVQSPVLKKIKNLSTAFQNYSWKKARISCELGGLMPT